MGATVDVGATVTAWWVLR